MKTKLFFALIAGFALSMVSCDSDSAEIEPPEEEEPTYTATPFTQSDWDQIATLKDQFPEIVITGFEIKYLEWQISCSRSDVSYHSNPIFFTECDEYERLLMYSSQYAILPLIFEKLEKEQGTAVGKVIQLLRDLTFLENQHLYEAIQSYFFSKVIPGGNNLPSSQLIHIEYCKILLEKDYDKMLKSIQDITIPGDEVLELNTVPLDNGILLLSFSSDALVRIYNSDGEIEYEANYDLSISGGGGGAFLDIRNLPEGIYVLQITVGSKTISAKIRRLIINNLEDIKLEI